jgi:FkbM family methyltransferase
MVLNERNKIINFIRNFLDFFGVDPGRRQKLFQVLCLVIRFFSKLGKDYLRTDSELRLYSTFLRYLYDEKLLSKKIDILKKNLDQESQELIDELISRYKYILTNSILSKDLFSEKEKMEQKNMMWKKIKKKYPNFIHGCIATYKYHNGLKFIPKEALNEAKDKSVIDAGGYDGDSAIMFRMNYEFGKIYSFEPLNKNFLQLKKNIKQLGINDVFPINEGLSDKCMKCGIVDDGASSFLIENKESEDINVTTIDDFVNERKLEVGLIKMDIEGFESKAIRSAVKTIKENKPILSISIYHSREDFFEIKPFIESFGANYKFKIIKLDPYSLVSETVLVGWVE